MMGTTHSDQAWKAYGKKDPYFGVITDEKFRDENLSGENLQKFFKTGEDYVNRVFAVFDKMSDGAFKPKTGLDFGCGTGRIAIPMAKRLESVVGIDISEDMLKEAEKNALEFKRTNVSFRLSDDDLSKVKTETFDLVNTYIVLQHMNVARGIKVIHRLVERVNPGGAGVIHVAYHDNRAALKRSVSRVRSRVPLVHNVVNVLSGKAWHAPLMQMNAYNLNEIVQVIQAAGVGKSEMHFEDHGGIWSVAIFFQKPG